MLKKQLILISIIAIPLTVPLWALTLQKSVAEAMNTNPIVQERIKNYRATQQDLDIAESEYFPKIDFSASFGVTDSGDHKHNNKKYDHAVVDQAYNSYTSSLKLTQNLFDGFGTMNKVDYQEARSLAAAYNYIEKANDIAFKMTTAYINVMRARALIQTARENVQINASIYQKVKDSFDAGLTSDSEVKKIKSSLSLAKSDLTVQINNSKDKEYNFKKILGRMPDIANMQSPDLNIAMPESLQRANLYAINHNPSILTAKYDLKGAQALKKQREKDFYPTVNLELTQNYNDQNIPNAAFANPNDSFVARIVLNYNLYNGGADAALSQKNISKINQELEIKRTLKRKVIEQLELSWNAYEMIAIQLKDLRKYKKYSEETLKLYKDEYDLGRRSLLDLLSAQNDVINSRSEIIKAEYAELLGKYRVLDAMGLLPEAVLGDIDSITAKVNLYTQKQAIEILDTIPIKLDVDNDNVVDNEDLCDNSLLENNIMPYGCKKKHDDADADGVFDIDDECPLTPANAEVSAVGCALDNDKDGVKDYEDECLKTPTGYKVDQAGCAISILMTINFTAYSDEIPTELNDKIAEFAKYLKEHPKVNVKLIGYSDNIGNESNNIIMSQKRAISFKAKLVSLGIEESRLNTEGKGFADPIADNSTEEGRRLNRRIEIELSK
jgi:adhesin transport system outer membrane protein